MRNYSCKKRVLDIKNALLISQNHLTKQILTPSRPRLFIYIDKKFVMYQLQSI